MERSFLASLMTLSGIALLAAALALQTILLQTLMWTVLLAGVGAGLTAWGMWHLRNQLSAVLQWRRTEIALYTLGSIGVLIALAYIATRYPLRFDLSAARLHSLSERTVVMLKRLQKPVHIVFFHDPLLRQTVELYELIASQTALVTVEFFDPLLNPAQARMRHVQFAGTAVLQSEGRTLKIHGGSEADIANGILRVSQGARQLVCFLDGHGEADPFSIESHDHLESNAGHTHGLGASYVLHDRHGIAKARHALETMNYSVKKITLVGKDNAISNCVVLVVAGPKTPLLAAEVATVRAYLSAGGNAFFMLDPFMRSGLEPVLRSYGVVLDDTIVIDKSSHFWADISSPAVSSYNQHQVTRHLPLTFYPGVRSLSPTSERVQTAAVTAIVNSSRHSFGETTPDRADFEPGRDLPGPLTLMVIVNGRPVTTEDSSASSAGRSRIAVIGDSDFATNSFFHILGNGNLFLNTVTYLSAQQNLIGIEPHTYDLPRVNLTNRQMKGTVFLSVILLPALLAMAGVVVWWRQR